MVLLAPIPLPVVHRDTSFHGMPASSRRRIGGREASHEPLGLKDSKPEQV
jgi:hypothetical protein